ncbi:MAG TPA: hypothetical protein VGB67_00260 [Fibrella sp.]
MPGVIEGIHPDTCQYYRMTCRSDGKVQIEKSPYTSTFRDRLTGKLEGQTVASDDLYVSWKGCKWLWETIKENPITKQHT